MEGIENEIINKTKLQHTNFEEKLQEILTGVNPRKEKEKQLKQEEERMKQHLKDIENERKIDFILNNCTNIIDGIQEDKLELLGNDYNEYDDINTFDANNNKKKIDKGREGNKKNAFYDFIKETSGKDSELCLADLTTNHNKQNKLQSLNPFDEDIYSNDNNGGENNGKENSDNNKQKELNVVNDLREGNSNEIIIMKRYPTNITKTSINVDSVTSNILLETQQQNTKNDSISKPNLLLQYHIEKQNSNELKTILSNNTAVSKNKAISSKNSFYDVSSKTDKLQQAREILKEKLTPSEKEQIDELTTQITQTKNDINDIIKSKNEYETMIKDLRTQIKNKKKEDAEFFEQFENKCKRELRSIINKFKLELYKKELEPSSLHAGDNPSPPPLETDNENNDINKLKEQITSLNKQLKSQAQVYRNKETELLNKIKSINLLNDELTIKIKSYEEDRIWNNLIKTSTNNKHNNNTNNKHILLNHINNITKLKKETQQIESNLDNIEQHEIKMKPSIPIPKNHINELDLIFPEKYHGNQLQHKVIEETFQPNGTIVRMYDTGKKEILFPSGQKKLIFKDGYGVVYYVNGDIKQIYTNYKETYFYAKDNLLQVKFTDGQTYLKYSDGRVEVISQ